MNVNKGKLLKCMNLAFSTVMVRGLPSSGVSRAP